MKLLITINLTLDDSIKHRRSTLATISFILGLLGLFMCIIYIDLALLLGTLAIITGVIVIVRAKRGTQKGRGLAISAIILGAIAVTGYFFYVYYVPQIVENIVNSLLQPLE